MTRAADDFDAIARRLADMRHRPSGDCDCPTDEREDGSKAPAPIEHRPIDDWKALRDGLGLRGVH